MRIALVSALAGAMVLVAPIARADSAAAESLFVEAKKLLAEGKAVEACKKLEESNRIEAAIGTRFQLAQCHEKTGKHASAWSGYLEVANEAKSRGQSAREKLARARAEALESKLVRMTIEARADDVPGMVVKRNGVVVERSMWGAAIPVDPGGYVIEASAPGRKPWKTNVEVTVDHPLNLVSIPELETIVIEITSSVRRERDRDRDAPPLAPAHGAWMKPTGIVLVVAGAVSVAGGLYFGSRAMSKNDESSTHCKGSVCDSEGVDLRTQAVAAGDASTIAFIAGGAALAVGSFLWLLSPDSPEPPPRHFDMGVGPRGVDIRGSF